MSIKDTEFEAVMAKMARENPDGAIVYAILRLAEAQEETAAAIDRLTEAVGKLQPGVLRVEVGGPGGAAGGKGSQGEANFPKGWREQ